MELKRALEILEYNKDMLTCDMSISRDPEHQDVSPDYYGKDAEDLYNAIVCVEKYIKNAIPVKWLLKRAELCTADYAKCLYYSVAAWRTEQKYMINGQWKFPKEWEKENARD